jgi:hypothetical protein
MLNSIVLVPASMSVGLGAVMGAIVIVIFSGIGFRIPTALVAVHTEFAIAAKGNDLTIAEGDVIEFTNLSRQSIGMRIVTNGTRDFRSARGLIEHVTGIRKFYKSIARMAISAAIAGRCKGDTNGMTGIFPLFVFPMVGFFFMATTTKTFIQAHIDGFWISNVLATRTMTVFTLYIPALCELKLVGHNIFPVALLQNIGKSPSEILGHIIKAAIISFR